MIGGVSIATGYIQVRLTTSNEAKSVSNASIRIYQKEKEQIIFEDYFMSDQNGKSDKIALYAPEKEISLDKTSEKIPYSLYNVEIKCKGYDAYTIENIQIFDGQESYLDLDMEQNQIPVYHDDKIEPHNLLQKIVRNQSVNNPVVPVIASMTQGVTIPSTIRVHLGRPDRNAENITVSFLYYLKNVASSEVYPTWPYEALKANIYCQMSLALNRVFTEWYPSKGYNFDITNSTAFDQAFVKNRNIFGIMSDIVDEVFMQYLRKEHYLEPYYAEYCDGRTAQCPGLKQWGTLDLANRGMDALEIIRYYYGNTIFIVQSDTIAPITPSYPGTPLRRGSSGEKVRELQEQLNAIAINYPAIPPIFPLDGIYGQDTEQAVRVFQRQFNLAVDGITGRGTWYRVSSIYAGVRKLAELGSLGILRNMYEGVWPGSILRVGNRSIETQLMQYYLSVISEFYPTIPSVSIDGIFGNGMRNAVIAFQREFGLIPDGVIGRATWDQIVSIYASVANNQVISNKEDDMSVIQLQTQLNQALDFYPQLPEIKQTGIYDQDTKDAVKKFQKLEQLEPNKIAGKETMHRLSQINKAINQVDHLLNDEELISKIKQLSKVYPALQKADSIKQLQTILGLTPSGKMNERLFELINEMLKELKM